MLESQPKQNQDLLDSTRVSAVKARAEITPGNSMKWCVDLTSRRVKHGVDSHSAGEATEGVHAAPGRESTPQHRGSEEGMPHRKDSKQLSTVREWRNPSQKSPQCIRWHSRSQP